MFPITKDPSLGSSIQCLAKHKEHLQYIRNNNPISAYAMHIFDNRHEFGSAEQ